MGIVQENKVPIEELLPKILVHAPSCPEPTAIDALRAAAILYCRALPVWHDVDTFQVRSPDYEAMFTIADAAIIKILDAQLDRQPLQPMTLRDLSRLHPNWLQDDTTGTCRYLVQVNPNSFTLYPKATGEFTALYRLRPSDNALTLPSSLVTDHGTFIAQGALGNLLAMPSTEWANAGLASFFLNQFAEQTNTAAQARALSGQTTAKVRSKGNMF